MNRYFLEELTQLPHCEDRLYTEDGGEVFGRGDVVTAEDVARLSALGIVRLFQPQTEAERQDFLARAARTRLSLSDLSPGQRLFHAIYDEQGQLLAESGVVLSAILLDALGRRGIDDVFIERDDDLRGLLEIQEFRREREARARRSPSITTEIPVERCIDDPTAITAQAVDAQVDAGFPSIEPEGAPLENRIQVQAFRPRSADVKVESHDLYARHHQRVAHLFRLLREGRSRIHGRDVGDIGRQIMEAMIRDRPLILNLVQKQLGDDYLVNHAIRTAILACDISITMRLGEIQVLEVAYAALLADVGMFRVSQAIRMKTGCLGLAEWSEIKKHPRHGLDLLQRIGGLPQSTPVVTYQVHERLDRSGYPNGRPTHLIHPYARIVMVADVFDALVRDRPYRAGNLPYHAMESILRMVAQGKLDREVVRALLKHLGLFPVGSLVEITGHNYAKVVQANPEKLTRPIVSVIARLTEHQAAPVERIEPPQPIDLSAQSEVDVLRAIGPDVLVGAGVGDDLLMAGF